MNQKINSLKHLLVFFVLVTTQLFSSTMYTLSGVTKVYPVVEIMTPLVPQEFKEKITNEISTRLDELKIDHSGYDQRAFAILVSGVKVKNDALITIELLIGEQVKRMNSTQETFAATFIDKSHFIITKDDDLEDIFEDSLSILLDRFSEQYQEENQDYVKIDLKEDNFAKALGYETSYEKAVAKAKKLKKNIMMVLVSNYCPWCRKFEQRVLLKKDVHTLVKENYIPLILNKEKDSFPKEYNLSFTPLVYFIDYKTLKSYETVVGYNKKDDFMYLIKKGK